jgi:YQGE family putative transporter
MMSRNEKILLFVNASYVLAATMAAVFVNVYLYIFTKSLETMTVYSMLRFGLFPLGFFIGGICSRKLKLSGSLATGLVVMMLGMCYLLFMNEAISANKILVFATALFFGIGEGMYWCSIVVLNLLSSTKQSRPKYLATMGVMNSFSSIVAPLAANWIIVNSISDVAGYLRIFQVVIVVYAITALLSMGVNVQTPLEKYTLIDKFVLKHDAQWRYIMNSHFLFGIRESVTLVLAGLLVYNATGGKGGLYSQLLAIFALISIISFYFAGKIIKRHNRLRSYQIGAFFVFTSTVVLVIVPNIYGAIYYGLMNAIAIPFFANPFSIIMMNGMQDYLSQESIMGRTIVKEVAINFGRVLGMALILVFSVFLPQTVFLPVAVIFASTFALIIAWYATIYHNKRDRLRLKDITEGNE